MQTRITSARVLAAAATVATAAVAMSSASAAPFAGKVLTASAAFAVTGTDSRDYRISVTLQSSAAPGATVPDVRLQVGIAKCAFQTCGSPVTYAKALRPGEGSVADDLSTAAVQTTFAGLPLRLSWAGGGGAATSVNVGIDPLGEGMSVADPASGDAGASGSVVGVTCFADGSIDGAYLVSANGSPVLDGAAWPSRTPAAFARSGSRAPRCIKA